MLGTDVFQFTKDLLAIITAANSRAPEEDESDKRHMPRFPCVADLKVFEETTPDSVEQFSVTAKNISLGGVGIRCKTDIPVDTLVVVVLEHQGISLASHARVVNCRPKDDRYEIGLVWEFD